MGRFNKHTIYIYITFFFFLTPKIKSFISQSNLHGGFLWRCRRAWFTLHTVNVWWIWIWWTVWTYTTSVVRSFSVQLQARAQLRWFWGLWLAPEVRLLAPPVVPILVLVVQLLAPLVVLLLVLVILLLVPVVLLLAPVVRLLAPPLVQLLTPVVSSSLNLVSSYFNLVSRSLNLVSSSLSPLSLLHPFGSRRHQQGVLW